MPTAFAAFRFALVGFTLPFMFVFRPELLMLSSDGQTAPFVHVVAATLLAVAGIVPFAAGIAGYLFSPLGAVGRTLLFVAAALLLVPHSGPQLGGVSSGVVVGAALLAGIAVVNWRTRATATA